MSKIILRTFSQQSLAAKGNARTQFSHQCADWTGKSRSSKPPLQVLTASLGTNSMPCYRESKSLRRFVVRSPMPIKHADQDPDDKIAFREDAVDGVLGVACHDFGRVTGGMPVEAHVYEDWVYSLMYAKVSDAPLKLQRIIKLAIRQFPKIRTADRRAQKKLGLDLLNRMIDNPDLQLEYRSEVKAVLAAARR
jgi:hypothetical protein